MTHDAVSREETRFYFLSLLRVRVLVRTIANVINAGCVFNLRDSEETNSFTIQICPTTSSGKHERSFEPEIDELVKKLHGAINCTEDL